MRTFAGESYIAIGGFIFLVFVATTLFTVIKNSLNDIWGIRLKEKPGFIFSLWLRARSFTAILLTGLLFVAAILIDSLGSIAGEQIEATWSGQGKFFTGVWNEVASLLIVVTWFVILFRLLADGRPTWRNCIAGGALTGILYSAGKLALSTILKNSNMSSIYGASASLVLILLFVFYSSFILYFGAAFIRVISERAQTPIMPRKKAYRFEVLEVED
jgi:membrane protein